MLCIVSIFAVYAFHIWNKNNKLLTDFVCICYFHRIYIKQKDDAIEPNELCFQTDHEI